MHKHKQYYKKHGIFSLIYTDADLANTKQIFAEFSFAIRVFQALGEVWDVPREIALLATNV
jgi:hypothetical protein